MPDENQASQQGDMAAGRQAGNEKPGGKYSLSLWIAFGALLGLVVIVGVFVIMSMVS